MLLWIVQNQRTWNKGKFGVKYIIKTAIYSFISTISVFCTLRKKSLVKRPAISCVNLKLTESLLCWNVEKPCTNVGKSGSQYSRYVLLDLHVLAAKI